MKKVSFILMLFFGCIGSYSMAQQSEETIQKGNKFYDQKNYTEAEKEFDKINEADSLYPVAQFNLANTLYRQGRKDEAIKIFDQLSENGKNTSMLSKLYYNTGVIYSSQQMLEQSISAYENALLKNPNDQEARENLQKALLELKKRNSPKQNNNQQQKQQSQSSLNQKQSEQKLKQLEQKEKEVRQRVQKESSNSSGSKQKDW